MPRSGRSTIALILLGAVTAFAALPARAATTQPTMKTIPPPALETLRRGLKQAEALLPAPEKPAPHP